MISEGAVVNRAIYCDEIAVTNKKGEIYAESRLFIYKIFIFSKLFIIDRYKVFISKSAGDPDDDYNVIGKAFVCCYRF